jgi:Gram-negative bacterial TonB protein C-terminal
MDRTKSSEIGPPRVGLMPAGARPKAAYRCWGQNGDATNFAEWFKKGMVDSVSSAQATPIEIPVTIQGARPVEGTARRELFTETTKTTLVFENGAVVNLSSRVSLGQCVFLRNDQSGREILCKVLNWRQVGHAGYTDLEFAAHDSGFWGVHAEQSSAAEQKPEAHKAIEAPAESPVTTPRMESGAATSGEMPATFLDTATTPLACPLPQTIETLPEPTNGLDPSDAKGAERLPALIADDARPKPEQEPSTPRTIEIERAALSAEVPPSGETSSDTASELRESPTEASQTPTTSEISARKNPIAIGIAASVLIAAVLGGAWHVKRGSSIHKGDQPFAASAQSRQHSLPAAAQPSQSPASRVSKGGTTTAGAASTNTVNSGVSTEVRAAGNNGGAIPAQAAQETQAEAVSQEPGDPVGQHPPATTTDIETSRESNSVADSSASVVPKVEATSSTPGSDPAALRQPKLQNSNDLSITVTVPAKIVSQSLPSIPTWAKGLDTDVVVQLDALIDEKGNVAQTKPLSGPRELQSAAEQAVALWIFEPALSDGKPTATHMVLTVQFQR